MVSTAQQPLKSPVRTGFHAFAGRSHWLCDEDGWEDVDRALAWAVQHAR
jgi:hypothetical protein